ncbi:hypothetical protein FE257_008352 [Aspergillus nanangensis]|uniref:Dioxygenase n=1 Tax=Aspergillus nanangensis TaxID=2582783 RepID=A0AAD4GTM1_ASPNN|nr:hypothetical protein FE257_008352 [Aspergillus nanangensis]
MGSITETPTHFNQWPNDRGFDANYEVKEPVELAVTGLIPAYAAGVLYRTGPGRYTVDRENGETFQVSHWFDGFSQTHRFQLVASDDTHSSTRVFYNSRFATDYLIEQARTTGHLNKVSFGQKQDPCQQVFQKSQTEYIPTDPSSVNIGVTLSINMPGVDEEGSGPAVDGARWSDASGIRTLWAKTDASGYKKLHPETLEPIGLASQKDLHPDLTGPLSASHARSDPVTGDVFNFNLAFEPALMYRVFRVSAATGETSVLASFPGAPAYLHSLLITEDYVLLSVWNSLMNPAALANGGSILDAIQPYDPAKSATWYVVDRKGDRGLVATYESAPFFCFHTINAWQEKSPSDGPDGVEDIVAELVTFDNHGILRGVLYENLISSSPEAKAFAPEKRAGYGSKITRFRLPGVPSEPTKEIKRVTTEWTMCESLSPELPTMNPKLVTRKHRYTYGVTDRGESTWFDGLMKFDSETKETLLWNSHAQSAGEPIFIANPEGSGEDDGILLSVVLDGYSGKSYLLCLDARSLRELGRADVNGPVSFGFHGQHVAAHGVQTGDY